MPLSGLLGSITVAGVAKTADKWTCDIKSAVIDRSNFTTLGLPYNARGQGTGDITIEGPYEGPLNIVNGQLYTFFLGVNLSVGITVQGRISSVQFSNDKDSGPRWRVQAAQYGAANVVLL